MPRANRSTLAGHIYHVTHRCHNREFLLRFAVDRDAYRTRLRAAAREEGVALLGYCVTSNHVHLLTQGAGREQVAGLMQKVEGKFAQYFNRRKRRSGAFWNGRYAATMLEGGGYLWNCLLYIDMNMVRAGVVAHPSLWPWCGYAELMGERQRYRLLDRQRLLEWCGGSSEATLRAKYQMAIAARVARGERVREDAWTSGIAVGSEAFVDGVAKAMWARVRLERVAEPGGRWVLREASEPYGSLAAENRPENSS